MLASPHTRDRDAGALGIVPAPPPRGGSFTGAVGAAAEPMSGGSGGRLSRASSTHSVGSWGSVPRSSSFTRSRKFARGDVLSLEDARHVLDSTAATYAGSLKFAAAQQILADHFPSVPERGAEPVVPPPPPEMPVNALEPKTKLRQPGPLPVRMPIPLIKARPKRPATPPPPKVEKGGTFNILVPAAENKPVEEPEPEPDAKKKGRAFGRMLSRAMSGKFVASASASSLPDVPEEAPEPVEEKPEKPVKPEKKKKVLRFDDRNTDIHINIEASGKSSSPPKAPPALKAPPSPKPRAAAPAVEGGFDKLRARASLPTFASPPARGDGEQAPSAARRLLRARTHFFGSSRASARGAAAAADPAPAAAADETLDDEEPEPLSPKPRVPRTAANSAPSPRLAFVAPFGPKRGPAAAAAAAATAAAEAPEAPEKPMKTVRVDSTTTTVPRSASSKVLDFFAARDTRAAREAREARLAAARASGDVVEASVRRASSTVAPSAKERAERNADAPGPAENAFRPTVSEHSFISPIRRFVRSHSRAGSAASSAKQDAESAAAAAATAPAGQDAPAKEPSAIQKSFAKAQAASASLVARAKKLPRGATIARMQGAFSRNSTGSAPPASASADAVVQKEEPKKDVLEVVPVVTKDKAKEEKSKSERNGDEGNTVAVSKKAAKSEEKIAGNKEAVPEAVPEVQTSKKSVKVPEKVAPERAASETVAPEMVAPEKSVGDSKSEQIVEKPTEPAQKDRTTEGSTLGAAIPAPKEAVVKAPMTEERAASDFGATTKDLPEFVTIKRVIRRVKADGTEEIITKRVRERPTAIRPNGDVVVQRTVRRLKNDGSGEKETVVIEKVIPRRSANAQKASRVADSGAGASAGRSIPVSQSGPVGPSTQKVEEVSKLKASGSVNNVHDSSRSTAPEAAQDGGVASNKKENRGERELRDEDWPIRYKSLQASKNSHSAENLVKEEMKQVEKRVKGKPDEVPPSSFGILQQGMPRGSSFHGQEPYVHGEKEGQKERLVRMPGAATYTNLSVVPVESTSRQNSSFAGKSGGRKKGAARKAADRDGAPLAAGAAAAAKSGDVNEESGSMVRSERSERSLMRWPKIATSASSRRASLTRVMSFDTSRRSQSDFDRHREGDAEGTENNRPGRLPKSSSVGGSSPRRAEAAAGGGADRFKVRSAFAGMLSSIRSRFQGSAPAPPPAAAPAAAA